MTSISGDGLRRLVLRPCGCGEGCEVSAGTHDLPPRAAVVVFFFLIVAAAGG
jgi:hypothetical protein